jgi:hypothetical protein
MTLTIEAGKYYRTRDGRKVGPIKNLGDKVYPFWFEDETFTRLGETFKGRENPGDLIAEWQDKTPAHIIQASNGRTYDLTALETPFGLLPEDVQKALNAWPHGQELWGGNGWWDYHSGGFSPTHTYRAKPAPQVQKYVLYWSAGRVGLKEQTYSDTHRITIRDDGTGKLTAEVKALK